jgi:hypothetical protein
MTDQQLLAYANASADALGIPMDAARALRVAGYLRLSGNFAGLLEAVAMGPELEPAEVFCPAPFPSADPATGERQS